jgi:hypothetical protein
MKLSEEKKKKQGVKASFIVTRQGCSVIIRVRKMRIGSC